MQKVDVYIKTSARGPAVRKHVAYMYVLKIVINGKEFVRNGRQLEKHLIKLLCMEQEQRCH